MLGSDLDAKGIYPVGAGKPYLRWTLPEGFQDDWIVKAVSHSIYVHAKENIDEAQCRQVFSEGRDLRAYILYPVPNFVISGNGRKELRIYANGSASKRKAEEFFSSFLDGLVGYDPNLCVEKGLVERMLEMQHYPRQNPDGRPAAFLPFHKPERRDE